MTIAHTRHILPQHVEADPYPERIDVIYSGGSPSAAAEQLKQPTRDKLERWIQEIDSARWHFEQQPTPTKH